MSQEKKALIEDIGFGGLLQLQCKEIRYELCHWLISQYDMAYSCITMATSAHMCVTLKDVESIMGIPCDGVDIALPRRRHVESINYNMSKLEEEIHLLGVGGEFLKKFMIFTCATIIAPNSMLEGAHDIWDFILDSDEIVQKNWGFMLSYLNEGKKRFKTVNGKYMTLTLLTGSLRFYCIWS